MRAERRPLVQKVVANGRVHVPVRIRLGTRSAAWWGTSWSTRSDHVRPGDLLLDLVNAEMQAGVACGGGPPATGARVGLEDRGGGVTAGRG